MIWHCFSLNFQETPETFGSVFSAERKLVAQMNQDRAAHSEIAVADLFGYGHADVRQYMD